MTIFWAFAGIYFAIITSLACGFIGFAIGRYSKVDLIKLFKESL